MELSGWKNKGGTSSRPSCRCGSWKQHWINSAKSSRKVWPEKCSVEGCNNKAEDGAHLWNPKEKGEYIVPLCHQCNSKGTDVEFRLKQETVFVPAISSDTCGE